MHYLVLLRGINVGGNNIIKMVDLKKAFESMGFTEVSSYIQSGNILFKSDEKNKKNLIQIIEEELSKRFQYKATIALLTQEELALVIQEAPNGFGTQPEEYRYDVIFLIAPLTAKEALQKIQVKEGVDSVHLGEKALYFSRLIAKASQSHLSKIIGTPNYKYMTIRNWNTTTKLLELMELAFNSKKTS